MGGFTSNGGNPQPIWKFVTHSTWYLRLLEACLPPNLIDFAASDTFWVNEFTLLLEVATMGKTDWVFLTRLLTVAVLVGLGTGVTDQG